MKYRWEFKTPSYIVNARERDHPRLALIYCPKNQVIATAVDTDNAQSIVDALNEANGS